MRKAVVLMMTSLETYLRRGQGTLRRWADGTQVRKIRDMARTFFSGLILSAGGLSHHAMPLGLGLLFGIGRISALVTALGSCAGYWLFWGTAGLQGMAWTALGLGTSWVLGRQNQPLPLLGSIGAFLVSAVGLLFQLLLDDPTTVPVYLMRVVLGLGSAVLWPMVREGRVPEARWAAQGTIVLALAQIWGLGFGLAGILMTAGSFPAAAMAGLALDLSLVTPVPMTALLCLCWPLKLTAKIPRWVRCTVPWAVYLLLMTLRGGTDPIPALALAVGTVIGNFLPGHRTALHRPKDQRHLQARLEQTASAMERMRQPLLEVQLRPIDESALTARVRERACGGCPCRKNCIQRLDPLPSDLLHRPLFDNAALPIPCKKPGRMILELRRAQEQLRTIKAERERMEEYRWAVQQQYQFLSHFLRQTAAHLDAESPRLRYQPEVAVCSLGKETANGDRCLWFAGTGSRYYILLCDGMGTGLGAAQEGSRAAELLRDLLSAGFPAEYALKSINSLLALCGKAGAVTVDLAEIELDLGRATLYKWGAAPAWVLRDGKAKKIGTAGPPPGLSAMDGRETVERLSLRRGEMLILLSDGVDGEAALDRLDQAEALPPGELAAALLEDGCRGTLDDATAAVIRLSPAALSTSYHAGASKSVETQDVG